MVTLWNSDTGKLEAIIEAFALGQMRTGGISGVATDRMAAREANELAIIGTGKQALTQGTIELRIHIVDVGFDLNDGIAR